MTDNSGIGIVELQRVEQMGHGGLLGRRAGVGRSALLVEASLIADANAVGVVPTGVGTGKALRATGMDDTIARDIIVVANAVEASCLVACLEVLDGVGLVAARGTAVNDDEVDAAHSLNS